MRNLRLFSFLVVGFGVASSHAEMAQNRHKMPSKLPAAVRAMMPRGAKSVAIYRVAPAPKAPRLILHVWTARGSGGRGNKADEVASPFVVDIFSDEKNPSYRTSLIYGSRRAPDAISLRYFNSKTKQGLVFQVDEFYTYGAAHRIFVVFGNGDYGEHGQTFTEGHGGGSPIYSFYSVRRAADGTLEIVDTNNRRSYTKVGKKIFRWNGFQFAPIN